MLRSKVSLSAFTGILSILIFFVAVQPVFSLSQAIPVELEVPQTLLTVQGYASPNALITISDDISKAVIATTSSTSLGQFSSTVVRPSGLSTISVTQTDVDGAVSSAEVRTVSVPSQDERVEDFLLSPTLTLLTSSQTQKGSIIQLRGYSVPSSTVRLYINNTLSSYSTTASISGQFEFLVQRSEVGSGRYGFSVDVAYNSEQSELSKQMLVDVIEPSAPSAPDFVVVIPQVVPPPVVEVPKNGESIDGDSVLIRGYAQPNDQITVYEFGRAIGSVFADANGRWEYLYVASLPEVSLAFDACRSSVCSVLSETLNLSFRIQPEPCVVPFELDQYRFWGIGSNDIMTLRGPSLKAPGTISIRWGDGDSEVFSYRKGNPISYQHRYTEKGQYNGTINIQVDNCSTTKYFSVAVEESAYSSKNYTTLLAVCIIIAPFAYVVNRRYKRRAEMK